MYVSSLLNILLEVGGDAFFVCFVLFLFVS